MFFGMFPGRTSSKKFRLKSGAATDIGPVRATNQDSLLNLDPLFAVADGMGGAAGGEMASQMAVAILLKEFDSNRTADGLTAGLHRANRMIWDEARKQYGMEGMGTTITAMALVEGELGTEDIAVVNVGDSRTYLLRDGKLIQVTSDHNIPGELLRTGAITPQQAAEHYQRDVLTRALGTAPTVQIDHYSVVPNPRDRFVLVSDGVAGLLDDLGPAALASPDPGQAARQVVQLARESGTDNLSAVIVDIV